MIGFRRALWALGLAGFVAGLVPLLLALGNEDVEDRALIAVFGPLIGWAFIGTGLFAWYRRPENRFGPLMTAVGFTWCLSGLAASDAEALLAIGLAFGLLPYGLLFHMLIAFPSGRLEGRLEHSLAALGYFGTTVLQWAILFFVDTRRDEVCGGCPANPLQAVDDQSVADALIGVQALLGIVLLVGVAFVLWRHWRSAGPSQRRVLGPVLASGLLVALFIGLSLVWDLTGFSDPVEAALDVAGLVALASIPFAFLVGLLRSRFSRAGAVSELVASLSDRDDRRRGLRDALADALADPGLTLAYWLPASGEYVNPEGQPCELPEPGSGRVATIVEKNGKPVAAIVHDASLEDEQELVRAVGGAADLALENERLDAELRANVEELRASRQRLVDAEFQGRRQLERDLHDGAQQRLVSLALELRMARSKLEAKDPEAAERLLEGASGELDRALAELRELARGIHPAALSDRGLEAALHSLAARAPLPVEVTELPKGRLPDKVESATYFVIAEALTNVAKYARASQATVRVVQLNGRVVVEVADNGVGGADPSKGSGLRGLNDRVSALEGRLALESEAGEGTTGDGLDSGQMRVLVADDSVLLREGVVRLLEEAGFEVVAQAGDAEDLLRKTRAHKPDVAVVDVRMPPTNTDDGLRAALEIRDELPGTGVLVLSQYVEETYALELVQGSAEGVGYLLKDRVADVERFTDSVRRVGEGGSALDPEVVAQLLGRRRGDDPLDRLTPREREVLALMAEGRSNHAIAEQLVVTERAVEKHVTSIFGKLGLPPAAEDHRRVLAVLTYLRA